MPLLRFDEKVPGVYVKESRDFQVLTRLFTLGLNQSKYNADSMQFMNDPLHVNNRLLTLLQQKVGFYTNREFYDDAIRKVCKMFYALVKHKGSKTAIIEAIRIFFRVSGTDSDAYVDIQNRVKNNLGVYEDVYTLNICIHASVRNVSLLEELLKYILPCGYKYTIYFYDQSSEITDLFANSKNVYVINAGYARSYFASMDERDEISPVDILRESVDTISIAPTYNGASTPSPNWTGDGGVKGQVEEYPDGVFTNYPPEE